MNLAVLDGNGRSTCRNGYVHDPFNEFSLFEVRVGRVALFELLPCQMIAWIKRRKRPFLILIASFPGDGSG
jgi:hypothetical protein